MCYSLMIVCSTAFDGVDVYGILCVIGMTKSG